MRTSYYNTTHSTHPDLNRFEAKAESQEEQILDWFKTYEQRATPTKILNTVFAGKAVPITSVRRAMTNLTNADELVKTDKQVKGPYGRPEYVWRLADKYNQRQLF